MSLCMHCGLPTLGMHDVCSRHDAGYGRRDRLPALIDEEVGGPSSGVFIRALLTVQLKPWSNSLRGCRRLPYCDKIHRHTKSS
jgi:hypothetical protein